MNKFQIYEYFDFGGGGPLVGEFSLEAARKEIKRLYSFGSIFVSYGIYDKQKKKFIQ